MNKKFIIFLLVACAGIVAIGVMWGSAPKTQTPPSVLSTVPADGASHNPYLPIQITLSRAPKEGEVVATLSPAAETKTSAEGNILKISPTSVFAPKTTYAVSLNTSPSYSFTFTTETDVENFPSYNESLRASVDAYQKEFGTQDAALADIRQNSPVTGDGFVITYSYKNDVYTVTLAPPADQSKIKFQSWLTQKGVTKPELLQINYIAQ